MLRCEDANESLIGMKASLYLKIFNNQKRPHCGRFFIFILVKISLIIDLMCAVGEEMVVKIDKIIISHTCNIVNYKLVWLGIFIRSCVLVRRFIDVCYMMCEYGRIGVVCGEIVQ